MNNQQTNAPKRYSLVPTIDDLTGLAYKTSGDSNPLLSSQVSLNSDPFSVFDYSLSNEKKLTGIVESQSSSNSDIDGVNLPVAPSQQLAPYVANQLVVKFQKGVTDAQIEQVKNGLGIVSTKTIGLTGAEVWKLSGTTSVENALARYQSNSLFEYIEPDYKVSPTSQSSSFSVANQKLTSVNPTLSNSSSTMAVSPSSGIDGVNLPMAPSQQLAPYVANQLIVKFKKGVTATQIDQVKNGLGIVSAKTISLTGAQVWKFSGISVESALAKYSTSSLFEYIEPDYIVTAGALTPKSTIPNDPSFSQLWGLNNTGQSGGTVDADIDAPEAWDIQTGNPNLVVGIIDTGVDYNHQDLVGNIWTNPGEIAADGIDNDGNGYIDDVRGWDFAYNDNNPMDVYGHGTHVSGTIAGKGNNGIGVTGVAWNAQIMPLKFLDDSGSGSTSNAILAISYATAKGVKITNNSWGGGSFSQALYDAINAAGQLGSLFIAAAGNDYGNNNDTNPHYPSSYNLANIISVASTTRTDSLSSFSNIGLTSVDLGAPGSDIYSTTPGNTYSTYSGTSMATPHVSGAAALLWSQNPTWTAQQVKTALMNTGDSLASLAGKTVSGKRLNVYNALAASNLPSVTVSVSPASVQEDGTTNLVYTFTRTSLGLSSPLTVNFGSSGTANASLIGADPADYTVLTNSSVIFNPTTKLGTVTFAANATTVQVVVDPIADTIAEVPNETVDLNINSGTGYIGGSPNLATGMIVSEEALPIFTNPNPITIQDYTASNPYPSTINVSGLSGNLTTLKVTLTNLSHTWPDDIDVLLVGPNGAKAILMSDVGGSSGLSNVTLIFDPLATAALPDSDIITSGTYLPTDFETGDFFNSPAPVGPYGTSFSVFNNTNPNGIWSLYIMDDAGGDSGSIAGGWSLNIGTTAPVLPVITVVATDPNAAETIPGATTNPGQFTLTRTGVTTSALTVNVLMSGTATNGTDYTSIPTTATFAIGSTTAVVNLNVIDDILVEQPIETAILTVGTGTGYIVGSLGTSPPSSAADKPRISQSTATITIADNDTPVSNIINAVDTGWYDNSGSHDPTNTNYIVGDNGILYRDWMSFNLPTFTQPVVAAQLKIKTYEYLSADASETYELRDVTTPVSTLVAGGSGLTSIYNDLGTGAIYGSRVFTSADSNQTITINLTPEAVSALNTKSGQAFALGGWLTTLDTISNSEYVFGFSNSLNPSADVQLVLSTAPALPVITVVATDASAAETIPGATTNPGQYTLTRTGLTTSALTVNVTKTGTATNGVDYTSIPTTVTFSAGSATALVPLNVIYDTLVEGTETAILNVTAGNGYAVGTTASATVSIADSIPVLPSITLASNYSGVSENSKTNLVYTFNRTGATTSSLTVNFTLGGTATRNSDYSAYGGNFLTATTGNIVFAAGATTAKLELVTTGDAVKEANETIAFTLAGGTGYTIGTPTAVTTTIINDDGVLNQQGTAGNDVIEAGKTSILSGKSGNDILIGSNSNEILAGGLGNDTLTGGAGFDTFHFASRLEGIDTLTDFNVSQDIIQASGAGFGGGLIAGESISSDQFSISLGSVTANTRFIFDKPTGKLFFDIDGSGSNSSVQFASLTANLGLTADNIFVA